MHDSIDTEFHDCRTIVLIGLFMMNTIVLREHNRLCDILKQEHPEWDDEQLFQTSKNIIAGK